MRILVFTDLDGSLLDPWDYGFGGAREALERLEGEGIPVVLVTSKTRAEVQPIQERLGIVAPFVVENGGGVFFPPGGPPPPQGAVGEAGGGARVSLGVGYPLIRAFLKSLPAGMRVRGFGDMPLEEVQARTGLSPDEARRARDREFSEPILPPPPGILAELAAEAGRRGFQVVEGGRFHHVMGAGHDKGTGVRLVRRAYEALWGGTVVTIGVGDSPNDLPMLEAVEVPVILPRASGGRLVVPAEKAIVGERPGSRGWNRAVLEALRLIRTAEAG